MANMMKIESRVERVMSSMLKVFLMLGLDKIIMLKDMKKREEGNIYNSPFTMKTRTKFGNE